MAIPNTEPIISAPIRGEEPLFYTASIECDSNETYIVSTCLSTPWAVQDSYLTDDEMTKVEHYKYPPEVRKEITKIRNWFRRNLDWFVIRFHSLSLTNESGKEYIKQLVKEANNRFAEIDSNLRANYYFVPLDVSSIRDEQIKTDLTLSIMLEYVKEIINVVANRKKLTEHARFKINEIRRKYKGMNFVDSDDFNKFMDAVVSEITLDISKGREWIAEKLKGMDLNVSEGIKDFMEEARERCIGDALIEKL